MGHGLPDIIFAETGSGDGCARYLRQPAHPAAAGGEDSGPEAGGEEAGLGGVPGGEGEAGEGGSLDSMDQRLQGAPAGSIYGDRGVITIVHNNILNADI